jgi:hypothetical protein
MVTIRASGTDFAEPSRPGVFNADCMIATSVEPSGVMVRPSIPWLALRSDNSRGSDPSNGESRSSSLPLASKWTMNGPYSSDTQNVPSDIATSPSVSRP